MRSLVPAQVRDGHRLCPFCVVVDSREQAPFYFTGMRTDARHGSKSLTVPLVRNGLRAGDYSVEGLESQVAVERKSAQDLFNTIGQGRKRFQRELERLSEYKYAAVVIEADWQSILTDPQPYSRLPPKIVFRSVIAWQQRYPAVHWWAMPSRRLAEVVTFRILERYWRDHAAGRRPTSAAPAAPPPSPSAPTESHPE